MILIIPKNYVVAFFSLKKIYRSFYKILTEILNT